LSDTTNLQLMIEDDAGQQRPYLFNKDVVTVGRKDGNAIRLNARNISRFHARFVRQQNGVHVEDLKSFNGVRLNGARIHGVVALRHGDVVQIGDYHFALQQLQQPASDDRATLPDIARGGGPSYLRSVAAATANLNDEYAGDTQKWDPAASTAASTSEDRKTSPLASVSSIASVSTWLADNGGQETHKMAPSPALPPLVVQANEFPKGAPGGNEFNDDNGDTQRLDVKSAPPPVSFPPHQTLRDTVPMQPIRDNGLLEMTVPLPPAPMPPPDSPLAPMPVTAMSLPVDVKKSVFADETMRVPAASVHGDLQYPRLVAISTVFCGSSFALTQPEQIVGRVADNDIVIDHKSVSRNHAKLVREGPRVRILDLKSANGILVNGEDVEDAVLRSGDVIELGRVRLRFTSAGESFVVSLADIEAARREDLASESATPTLDLSGAVARAPQAPPDNRILKAALVGFVLIAVVAFALLLLRDRPAAAASTSTVTPPVLAVASPSPPSPPSPPQEALTENPVLNDTPVPDLPRRVTPKPDKPEKRLTRDEVVTAVGTSRPSVAEDLLRSYIENSGEDSEIDRLMAVSLLAQKKNKEACVFFRRVKSPDPATVAAMAKACA
jgi:pSer/pThr/pTyr-binding forkhead associated (FHA) protein